MWTFLCFSNIQLPDEVVDYFLPFELLNVPIHLYGGGKRRISSTERAVSSWGQPSDIMKRTTLSWNPFRFPQVSLATTRWAMTSTYSPTPFSSRMQSNTSRQDGVSLKRDTLSFLPRVIDAGFYTFIPNARKTITLSSDTVSGKLLGTTLLSLPSLSSFFILSPIPGSTGPISSSPSTGTLASSSSSLTSQPFILRSALVYFADIQSLFVPFWRQHGRSITPASAISNCDRFLLVQVLCGMVGRSLLRIS